MSEKYVVSQEFMNELENSVTQGRFVSVGMLSDLPDIINNWRITRENNESNNRLIAIIRWLNGEDVFEVEKSKKWIVRSKNNDTKGIYSYVSVVDFDMTFWSLDEPNATRFDTKEEAQEWANSHQEVIEVDE